MIMRQSLDALVARYESPAFIAADPVAIPHAFDDPRDQEVIALFAALLAWGRRETTLSKMEDLCRRMDYRPRKFVLDFDSAGAKRLEGFKHRTFQPGDAQALVSSLRAALRRYDTLETLFVRHLGPDADHVGPGIEGAMTELLSAPGMTQRMRKHLPRPSTASACKRVCLYLRWMVRPGPVDLAIWRGISPAQLVLPLDTHSGTQARKMGMLSRTQNDWRAAMELTGNCRNLDSQDPCRYDYAFFGVGVDGRGVSAASADEIGPPSDT